jgi:hypothetical protein
MNCDIAARPELKLAAQRFALPAGGRDEMKLI